MTPLSLLDVKLGVKRAARSRQLLFGALVCLGFGMGSTVTAFKLLNAVILRPFPGVTRPGRVLRLTIRQASDLGAASTVDRTSYGFFNEIRQDVPALRYVAGVLAMNYDDPLSPGRSVKVALVTGSYFDVFGARAKLGRQLADQPDPAAAPAEAVISDSYWRRAYGGSSSVIGSRLWLRNRSVAVVGVMPSGFRGDAAAPIDIWLPLALASEELPPNWRYSADGYWLRVIGRLRTGATVAIATRETNRALWSLGLGHASDTSTTVLWSPLSRAIGTDGRILPEARVTLWVLGLSALVLVMSAVTMTSLMLSASVERQTENALRGALGANGQQLISVVLIQSAVLAFAGAIAAGGVSAIESQWADAVLPVVGAASGGWAGAAQESVVLVLLTGLMATIVASAPVMRIRSFDLGRLLRTQSNDTVGISRARVTLLTAQVAFSTVVVAVAVAFGRSLLRVRSLDLGFDPSGIVVAQIDSKAHAIPLREADRVFVGFQSRLERVKGVRAVGVGTSVPFLSADGISVFSSASPYPLESFGSSPFIDAVTPSFFQTLRIHVLAGRELTDDDRAGSERVAVISENLARRAWGTSNPLGRCLHLGDYVAPCTRVVGIVGRGRLMRLREDPKSFVYLPLDQNEFPMPRRAIVVRVRDNAAVFASYLRRWLAEQGPPFGDAQVGVLADAVAPQEQQWAVAAEASLVLALLALGLAAYGVYGTASIQVTSLRSQLAVRAALGAKPLGLAGVVLGPLAIATVVGLTAGVGLLLAIASPLSGALFETTAAPPLAVALTCAVLIGLDVLVVAVPVRHVVTLDLAGILRGE